MSGMRLAPASSAISTVTGGGSHGSQPPAFVLPPRNARVALGGDARLEGKVHGRPEPQVTWYKDGRPVVGGERCFTKQNGRGMFSLMVGGVTAEDLGCYTCQATNQAGSRQVTVEILLDEISNKKYGLPSSIKPGCRSAVQTVQSRASIWGESPPRFITKPSRVSAKPGQTAKFSAKTTGRPQPQLSWQRGEAELEAGGRVSIYERSGLHFLELKEVCVEDEGSYTCVVSNSVGSTIAVAELCVHASSGESTKPDPPSDVTSSSTSSSFTSSSLTSSSLTSSSLTSSSLTSSSLTSSCLPSSCLPSSCLPSSSLTSSSLTSSSLTDQPIEEPPHSSRLRPAVQLPPVAPRRTASSVKSAVSSPSMHLVTGGSDNHSAVKTLSGCDLRFEAVPLNQEATEGTRVTFTCQVSAATFSAVSWLKDGAPVEMAAGVEQRQDGPRLTLTMDRVRAKHQGSYRCELTTAGGATLASTTWSLRVNRRCEGQKSKMTESRSVGEGPRFVKCLSDLKVMDGSRVTMTVEITGQPPPEVSWFHDGQEVTETEDFHLLREKNRCTLLIQEVFPEDNGSYSCRAWNQHGEASTHARLTVEEPQDGVQPWFITKPKALSATVGQHVLLSCAIAGDPFPQFTWSRCEAGRPLSSGGDYELLQKEDVISLLIRRVQQHHSGEYLVSLRNSVGECSAVACLSVSDEGEGERSRARRAAASGDQHSPTAAGSEESAQWQSSEPEFKQQGGKEEDSQTAKEDLGAPRGLLKRSVETRERGEDEIRQREAQQLDFRSLLGRRSTPSNNNYSSSSSNNDCGTGQEDTMDFKANLKGLKSKFEDDRKSNSTPQVDFRAVLGKKGSAAASPSNAGNKPSDNKNATDFRSVLANKKKAPEKNGETPEKPAEKEKEKAAVNNCVDGAHREKKATAGGGGGGGAGGGGGKGPEFKEKLSDVTAVDGQRLRLQCRLADPAGATVTWTLDGKVIKASKFIVLANEGGLCSLSIDKALPEDEGQYKCVAENATGRSECSCMVLVVDPSENSPADKKSKKATPTSESEARIKKPTPKTPPRQAMPPQILQFPEDMKILAGEKVEILCRFSGAPTINCTWLKFRKPIQEGASDISIESTDSSSKLTIASGQQEHCGCYTVELRNSYGLRQAALNLTIVDKPDPPAKVPAASDVRRASLTLSWYGPTYDGGSAVQSYNLEIWDSLGNEWKHLVSCNSTSYNVQNLLPERQYKFRVRAENMYGVGEPSVESEPVTMGLVDDETQEEAEEEDDEKEPDYRDVSIRVDVKVKDLYDVEERLGTGKFGQVFKLVEKATKKIWAGKFIKAYKATDKDNVRQEISIMNSLHHPKLVQCVDAFEGKSDVVMVLELISGGELFERIIDEDFELSEREVIKYMLQIIDGVSFIHKQGIVHLDLKPENIMCVNKTGSKIKLIDFGLARRLENAGTLKVLFGTPEFVAPEVINYEAISYPTDMWSIGVICYILLSGLSPFMGDNDNETLSNVTSATWDFEDEAFDEISDTAKDFITQLLRKDMKTRLTCAQCYEHPWLKQDTNTMKAKKLSKERMKKYILRRKWQKTGHAVRAISRLSSMAMMAGVSAKKGSPTEEDNPFLECLEYEQKAECKPTFSSVIKDVEVVEGSAARFDCKIEGYPDPEVVWYKDELPIKETRHFQIDYDEEGNCSLVISEVSGDDDAKYTVKAVNSLGEATCTAELLVEVMAEEEEEEEEE